MLDGNYIQIGTRIYSDVYSHNFKESIEIFKSNRKPNPLSNFTELHSGRKINKHKHLTGIFPPYINTFYYPKRSNRKITKA